MRSPYGRAIWVVLAGALALALACSEAPAYQDPSWAPDWFKQCTGLKQWAQWAFTVPPTTQIYPEQWDANYSVGRPIATLTDNASWYPRVAGDGWVGYQNLDPLNAGSVDYHIRMDNVFRPDLYKQVWLSLDIFANVPTDPSQAQLQWQWQSKPGLAILQEGKDFWITDTGSSFTWVDPAGKNVVLQKYTLEAYYEIWPQPSYEEWFWKWDVPVGGTIFVDDVHMVTQCIPEPVFFQMGALVGMGGLAFLKARRP